MEYSMGGGMEGFTLINEIIIKHVKLTEYISNRTGLRVFLLAYDSPIVNSYYVLPTQAYNNDGLPHTLEHLIFLGSQLYPCRGTLDMLACRALSMGTNAWTSVDHTAYTISTAGINGTLKILPVYLDHILRPTLTEESFMTDVHHITSDGSNSGTVYCEMKTHENSAEYVMHFETLEKLYPGESSYKLKTGGSLEGLRSTDVHKVREYHKLFYRLDNLSIVICGGIKNEFYVLDSISRVELEFENLEGAPLSIGDKSLIKGCWHDPRHVEKFTETVRSKVTFPNEEEDNGNYTMAWRGPEWSDLILLRSISFIGLYLVESTTSPLEKALIHTDVPYGSCVHFSLETFKETNYQITVKDVPCSGSDKMDTVEGELRKTLLETYNSPLDMDRMRILIKRSHLNYLRNIETSPHETLIDSIVEYIIYSSDRKQLENLLCQDSMIEELLNKDESYWKRILNEYFIEPPYVSVQCLPSIARSKELQEMETALIKSQLETYGLEALMHNKLVVESVTSNSGVVPEISGGFDFCDTSDIELSKWPILRNFKSMDDELEALTAHKVDVIGRVLIYNRNGGNRHITNVDELARQLGSIKFPMQINHIASDFVRLHLLFSTRGLDLNLQEKRSLLILCILLFESDLCIDGKLVKSEDFIKGLMGNTTAYGAYLGLNSSTVSPDSYSDFISIFLVGHTQNYKNIFDILLNVMRSVQFSENSFKHHVKSLMKSLSKKKRSAKCLVRQASSVLRIKEDSIQSACSLGQQYSFLSEFNENLEKYLMILHRKIFTPDNMCVHVTSDLSKLPDSWLEEWQCLPCKMEITKPLMHHYGFRYGMDEHYKEIGGIFSHIASTDVSYFTFIVPAPFGYGHMEYCALSVLAEYLSMEGPLFRAVRGGGYAYNCGIYYSPSRGELNLSIQQSTDLLGALKVTQELINSLMSAQGFPMEELIAAKSSMIFRIISDEETLPDYSQESFTGALQQTGIYHNEETLDKVKRLTVEDIRKVSEKYLSGFLTFEGPPKTLVCITSKNESERVYRGLKDLNYNNLIKLTPKQLFSFLSTGTLAHKPESIC